MAPRVGSDHVHPEYWTEREHERFEDRVTAEIHDLRETVEKLARTVALLLGGIALLAFLMPLFAPLLRGMFGIPT